MGTAKRERQKQGRQARLAQAQAAEAKRKRFRTFRNLGILVIVVLAAAFIYSATQGDDGGDVTTGTTASTLPGDTTGATGTTAVTVPPVSITIPPAGAAITGETPCPAADGSSERTTSFEQAPPTCIDPAKAYTAEVVTSEGTFTITLDAAGAPETVNNFVVLARYHFFDGVAFHRIVTGFVNQTGDAVGPQPGVGDPGYTIADELPDSPSEYVAGAVAMANSGPNTGGSQWFVVVGTGGGSLTADYSLFGQVTDGMDVVDLINTFGSASSGGEPTKVVTIESVTITEA